MPRMFPKTLPIANRARKKHAIAFLNKSMIENKTMNQNTVGAPVAELIELRAVTNTAIISSMIGAKRPSTKPPTIGG
jgi:hypothetical protein